MEIVNDESVESLKAKIVRLDHELSDSIDEYNDALNDKEEAENRADEAENCVFELRKTIKVERESVKAIIVDTAYPNAWLPQTGYEMAYKDAIAETNRAFDVW